MAFDDNPFEISVFTTLHPDGEIDHSVGQPARTTLLTELPTLAGTAPYATLRLADGIELHHQPASTGTDNPIAAALAAHHGYEGLTLRGPVYITGDSADSDTATGMELNPFDCLYRALRTAADTAGTRLYRKILPSDEVLLPYDDFAPGDVFWFLGTSHRVLRFEDMDPQSVTAQNHPGARVMICDDEFEITALPGAVFPERADHAPAGFWQRTGHQLLPAGR
ncbi:hypothetical protein [Streptomyces melanogenes]|uniref:hypothetical protein n=1 Tax=Streptomyces melanogenes TaxID=67326 RepID=UPI0037AEC5FF